jgi:hypothetical protein
MRPSRLTTPIAHVRSDIADHSKVTLVNSSKTDKKPYHGEGGPMEPNLVLDNVQAPAADIDPASDPTPIGWRKSRKHKIRVSVPNRTSNRGKTNLGPQASRSLIHRSDVTGRNASILETLFRRKSHKSMFVLKLLQCALVGNIIDVSHIFADTAPYLRTAGGMTLVYRKPSFEAVRLIILSLKESRGTTFRLPKRIQDIVQEEMHNA